jgi:hypothetical protein
VAGPRLSFLLLDRIVALDLTLRKEFVRMVMAVAAELISNTLPTNRPLLVSLLSPHSRHGAFEILGQIDAILPPRPREG